MNKFEFDDNLWLFPFPESLYAWNFPWHSMPQRKSPENSDFKLTVKLFAIKTQFRQFLNCVRSQMASIENQPELILSWRHSHSLLAMIKTNIESEDLEEAHLSNVACFIESRCEISFPFWLSSCSLLHFRPLQWNGKYLHHEMNLMDLPIIKCLACTQIAFAI